MARLAFFTEQLPPSDDPVSSFAYELMKSLADQEHEVRVFSTYRPLEELPPSHSRLSILRPFRKWSWLELPKLLPILVEFQPEIFHFIQPRLEALQGLTNAMSAVPALSPMVGRPSIVSSFYDLRENQLNQHRLLLMASDAVTVSSARQATLLNDWFLRQGRRTLISVLPLPGLGVPNEIVNSVTDQELQDAAPLLSAVPEVLETFLENSDQLIFLPGDIGEHLHLQHLFDLILEALLVFPESSVVFGGGWGQIHPPKRREFMRLLEDRALGGRFLISGPLSIAAEKACYQKATVVFAASLPTESLRVSRLLRDALNASALLVLSEGQADTDTLPWRDREHALITEGNGHQSWGPRLAEALTLGEVASHMRSRLLDFAASEAVDQPANVMSRLYSRLINEKPSRPK